MDKKKVGNTKTNKKRVNNTNFKTNLTVQAVLGLLISDLLRHKKIGSRIENTIIYFTLKRK